MEFSSVWYFCFWSLVSLVFSIIGIYALRRAIIPVPELVELQLERGIILSVICSPTYAFLGRPLLEHARILNTAQSHKIFNKFYLNALIFYYPSVSLVAILFAYFISSEPMWSTGVLVLVLLYSVLVLRQTLIPIFRGFKYSDAKEDFLTCFGGPLWMFPYHTICWFLFQGLVLLSVRVMKYPTLGELNIFVVAFSVSIPSYLLGFAAYLKKLVGAPSGVAYAYKHGKIVEIILGCLGTTIAQYYFRAKSVPLMVSFLSLAIAWLGNLANVLAPIDFGIFHFLVTASMECAVSLFGLHLYTFLVVVAGILLMVLRWKTMESVSLRHDGIRECLVNRWIRFEELYGGNDFPLQMHPLEQTNNTC